jgi:hypothetical protein
MQRLSDGNHDEEKERELKDTKRPIIYEPLSKELRLKRSSLLNDVYGGERMFPLELRLTDKRARRKK